MNPGPPMNREGDSVTPTTAVQCPTPEHCARVEDVYGYPVTHLTVRESDADERRYLRPRQKYVVVDTVTGNYLGAFGLIDGGSSKAEAVFWAERWASKNGGHFIRPAGWEKVVGALPGRNRT